MAIAPSSDMTLDAEAVQAFTADAPEPWRAGWLLKDQSSPNKYYVSVHTAKYPAGAIRGQLIAGMVKL